ncbi:hypothetical protein IPA_05380 [Ignicoccus pacificus DSM 13166]|uniref:Uncharacterized protein n=1 Tax=Ignicoccus pacificus DSM 13166 TaxID=940294 RepID=A0A977KC96_9CREN|nr:hypothetical protein IPA_05380 [Ignicoccus pacificus DSM 13166]
MLYAFFIYDQYPLSYNASKTFDEYVFTQVYPLPTIMDPNGTTYYTQAPFYNALAALSLNDTSVSFLPTLELIVNKQFDSTGMHIGTYYQELLGESNYDYLATLWALVLAMKSQRVDGALNLTDLLNRLDLAFWTSLYNYLQNPQGIIAEPGSKGHIPLMIMMVLALNISRSDYCKLLNETYLAPVYRNYTQGTLLKIEDDAFYELLGTAAIVCAKLGYLNYTYAKIVAQWILNSLIALNGKVPNDVNSINLYESLLDEAPPDYRLFFVQPWPKDNTSSTIDSVNNVTIVTRTMYEKETVTTTTSIFTLYSTSEVQKLTMKVPAPALLGPLLWSLRRRRRRNN